MIRSYRLFYILIAIFSLCVQVLCAQAQFTATTQNIPHDTNRVSRTDMWFAIPQNYEDQGGKYFYLYVTATTNASVHIETAMGTLVQSVAPYHTAAFNIPLGWEIKNDNVIEDKAIHIWADASISAVLMSHNPYTSDATAVLPSQQCGTDYVVAAGPSATSGLADPRFRIYGDYPSEFVIAAQSDSTRVEITPSHDLRGATSREILYPAHQKFTINLKRGQTAQFAATGSDSLTTNEDASGTIIHSNKTISVMGASQCASIPTGYSGCDHVLEMMSPVQNWGSSYYTAPTIGKRKGDSFLIVSTVQDQRIYRYTDSLAARLEVAMSAPYSMYKNNSVTQASHWYSDDPFYLVQYMNSAKFDCDTCQAGDPSEMVVYPMSASEHSVTFQTMTSQGSASPYTNYANVAVHRNAAATTLFDGKAVTSFSKLKIDGEYDIYRVDNVKPGVHRVVSDSGMRVSTYGIGSFESYSYGVPDSMRPVKSNDTLGPAVSLDSGNKCITLNLTDTSGIASIQARNTNNLTFTTEPTQYYGQLAASATLCAVDSTMPVSDTLEFQDLRNNITRLVIFRKPSVVTTVDSTHAGFELSTLASFDSTPVLDTLRKLALLVTDTSKLVLTVDSIWGSLGFSYEPGVPGSRRTPFTLQPGETAQVGIGFVTLYPVERQGDVFVHTREAGTQQITFVGSGIPRASVSPTASERGLPFQLVGLSPNPSAGYVTIRYFLESHSAVEIAIFDLLGRRMYNFHFTSEAGQSEHEIDLRALPAGSYIYRVEAGTEVRSGKLTVRH